MGELIQKPTRILLTIWSCLAKAARKCSRDHVHAQFCGRTLLDESGKRVPATRLAAAYSRGLGEDWARLAQVGFCEDGISGCPLASLRRWRLLVIFRCGDAEPHPGPSARARVIGRDVLRTVDIRAPDVNDDTGLKYDEALVILKFPFGGVTATPLPYSVNRGHVR